MENKKAPEAEAMVFDSFRIEPTGELGCFRVFVNGVEDKWVRSIKIEMGVDNRFPIVTIEKYAEVVEGIDFDKCTTAIGHLANISCVRQQSDTDGTAHTRLHCDARNF
jgi:hypothetical protein